MAIFARNLLGITEVFFLFALYNLGESVERPKYGCSVWKKKPQLSPFQIRRPKPTRTTSSHVSVFEPRSMMTSLFVKDEEELSKSTEGLESRFILLVLPPVIFEQSAFPYLQTLFYDMASPSSALMPAAFNNFIEK